MHGTTLLTDWLMQTTWQSAVLVAAIGLLQLSLGRWLSPRTRYAMWMIILLRLAMPALPATGWSAYNWLPARATGVTRPAGDAPAPIARNDAPSRWEIRTEVLTGPPANQQPVLVAPPAIPAKPVTAAAPWDWRAIALAVWASGAMVMLLRMATQSIRAMALRRNAQLLSLDDLELAADLRAQLRHVAVMESALVSAPSLCGLIRPAILLPHGLASAMGRASLQQVLRHELAHLRRRDHWTNALMRLMQTIHWFNPAAWFAFSRCRLERELACDEAVLRQSAAEDRELYGKTLLTMATQMMGAGSRPSLLAMAEGKRHLVRRIHGIAEAGSQRRSAVLAVVLVIALGIAGLTRGQAPSQDKTVSATADTSVRKDTRVTRTYDLSDVVGLEVPGRSSGGPSTQEGPRLQSIVTPTPGLSSRGTLRSPELYLAECEQMIRDTVEPDSWKQKGGTLGEIRVDPARGEIIVTHTPECQQEIARLVDDLVALYRRQVTVEVRLIALCPDDLSKEDRKWLEARAASGKSIWDTEEMNRLIRPSHGPSPSMIAAPRVTLFSGGSAKIEVSKSTSYVAEWKPADKGNGYEPVVQTVENGLTLDVHAAIIPGERKVILRAVPRNATLLGLKDFAVMPTNPQPLIVQQPETSEWTMDGQAVVPDGKYAILGKTRLRGEREVTRGKMQAVELDLYVVVRATIADPVR